MRAPELEWDETACSEGGERETPDIGLIARLFPEQVSGAQQGNGHWHPVAFRPQNAGERRHDEFLALISHELRSPLAAIHNAALVLGIERSDSPLAEKALHLIERQVNGMRRTVDDLLEISRVRTGRLSIRRARIDLCVVVRNAIETAQSEIADRQHRLEVVLPDVPVWLQADQGRLEQVFVNLLANAARYTPAGGRLSVSMRQESRNVAVIVRDSGAGIAPDLLPHIFDLFTQGDPASGRVSGLGIGLALVRSLVALHGGRVAAESAGVGEGSEFAVYLPAEA